MQATLGDFLSAQLRPPVAVQPPTRADLDRRAILRGKRFRVTLWYHGVPYTAYGKDEVNAYLKAFDKSAAPSNLELDLDPQGPCGYKQATYLLI
jgi:hypothetical protein